MSGPKPFFDRARSRAVALWRELKNEHSSPREIAWAVGIGIFAGCTPAVGFHGWVALAMAALLRKNKLWAWVGSRISNVLILPFIILAELQVAHKARTGQWLALSVDEVKAHGASSLILDWFVGSLAVGTTLGLIFGLLTYALATWRQSMKRGTLAPPPPPSSESPASG
ncbi:MAG: DUF2062 domain-containing protein [Polyangiaceae bacterium]